MIHKKLDLLIEITRELLVVWKQGINKTCLINQESTLMTKQEVLRYLNISESTYKRRVREGRLKPMRLGGGDMFYKEDLEEVLWESKRRGKI